MRLDPIEFLVFHFRSLGLNARVTGDMTEHTTGGTTVYFEHSGGFRVVRDSMDRAEIEYSVYSLDRKECADIAYRVRELLLESLPNAAVGGALVLDVAEISSPQYFPDRSSREHMYGGEVALFYVAD
ncbi:hypothetical protein ACIOEX_20050 [Streptomyces sp. NPDC087850]|uniref:hypothetical protein n=1 Tax=Streptomyces sp. NPDC087850 TaxID=3365809 RepID=UPI0038156667